MNNLVITQSPITQNPCYKSNTKKSKIGYMQHSTGTPGGKAESFIKSWNKPSAKVAVEFVIDDTGIYQLMPIGIRSWHSGSTANNTHVGCEVCEPQEARLLDANWYELSQNSKNNTSWAVLRLQQELEAWGYDPNRLDGNFGPGCKAAVQQFQKDQGLNVDGCVGKNTLHRLQTRQGSLLKYDATANQTYFEDVYRKAVYTCAYVIKQLGSEVNNTNVLSHAEGYKKGIASNHADVGHWWPEHGKSMDDFRQDVKTYMQTGVLPYEEKEDDEVVENQDYKIYVVKEGDTWWGIAQSQLGSGSRYGELQVFNGLGEGAVIHVGDEIKIPIEQSETPDEELKQLPESASDWAQEAWVKAYNKGVLDGTNPQGVVSREMLAVVLDALKLLD